MVLSIAIISKERYFLTSFATLQSIFILYILLYSYTGVQLPLILILIKKNEFISLACVLLDRVQLEYNIAG